MAEFNRFAIIISKDKAGENIKEKLLALFDFEDTGEVSEGHAVFRFKGEPDIRIYTNNNQCIFNEDIDKKIDSDFFVFATTHSSEAGIPSLSVHSPGNWDKAELGGRDRELCFSSAFYLKQMYVFLNKFGEGLDYEIVNEVTHHGPYLEKPVMFIEIGSSEKQWPDPKAGEVIARTIMEALQMEYKSPAKVAVGIGGQHTCSNFNRIVLESDIAVSHICPKYMLEFLNKEILQQAIDRTVEGVELVILDWKGLGQYKDKVKLILEDIGIEWKTTKDIRKTL